MDKRKKKWGDRFDGYWVKDMDALHVIMPHIYDRRSDSEVYAQQEFDVTKLLEYIEKRNLEHPEYKTTIFHAILFGIGKLIYHRPLLNRFIAARRTYQRYNVDLAFMVKKQFADTSEEAMLKETVQPSWTLDSLSKYIHDMVKEAKDNKANSSEDTIDVLAKLPRPLLAFVVSIIRFLDKHGKLPLFITSGDINYSTIILTNLGSIKGPAVYHHLSEYGTASIIAAIGTIEKRPVYGEDGSLSGHRSVVEIGVTLDERLADGFYFIRSLQMLNKMFDDPSLFELPIEVSIDE